MLHDRSELAQHLNHVLGHLGRAGAIARPPPFDDRRLPGPGQRFGHRGGDLGQHLERLDRKARLVVELERLGQHVPRLGLCFALGLDRLGLGETDLAAHRRFRFGLGEALGLERLGGLLAPLALRRGLPLDRYCSASARRSASYFLASAFSRIVALSSSFWRSTSFSAIRMSWTLSSISPALTAWASATSTSFLIDAFFRLRALSATAISVSTQIRFCSFCWRACSSSIFGVAIGVGGRDAGVLQSLLDLRLSERVEVALVVLDVLEDEGTELETHALEIHVGLFADLVLEALLVPVQLLDRQGADDAAQVAGHRLLDRRLDLVDRHAEETLGGAADMIDVALHLDLGHGLDVDRDALDGVDVAQVDVEGHHAQRKTSYCSHAGHTKVPPPRMMRKPSISPFSSRTFLPNTLRRPKTINASSGPAFL